MVTAAVLVAAATTLVGSRLSAHDLRAKDFPSFYAGGRMLLTGQRANLYSLAAQETMLQSLIGTPRGPYYTHPPFEALAFALLAFLPLSWAYGLWMGINFGALVLGALAFRRAIGLARQAYWSLLGLVFLPALYSITTGQESVLLLVFLAFGYALMVDRPFLSGLLMSVVAIKFQYVVILAPLLLLMRRRRTAAGLVVGCIFLTMLSLAIFGIPGLRSYFDFIRVFDKHPGSGGVLAVGHMVNARGFLHYLGINARWEIPADLAILGVAAYCCWRARKQAAPAFAVTLTACIVGSHFAHLADATILLLPLLIALDEANRTVKGEALALRLACAATFVVPTGLLLAGNAAWNRYMSWNFLPFFMLFLVLVYTTLQHARETESNALAAGV